MTNMWVDVKHGNYSYRRNFTSNQLLARYVVLGADLRELYENFDTPEAKNMLNDIIEQHQRVITDEL